MGIGEFMAVLTAQALLESIETAITTILTSGQDVTVGERRYKRGDLGKLQEMRRDLLPQYYMEQNGPLRNHVRFDDPQ
jgi:hypothetical protein